MGIGAHAFQIVFLVHQSTDIKRTTALVALLLEKKNGFAVSFFPKAGNVHFLTSPPDVSGAEIPEETFFEN